MVLVLHFFAFVCLCQLLLVCFFHLITLEFSLFIPDCFLRGCRGIFLCCTFLSLVSSCLACPDLVVRFCTLSWAFVYTPVLQDYEGLEHCCVACWLGTHMGHSVIFLPCSLSIIWWNVGAWDIGTCFWRSYGPPDKAASELHCLDLHGWYATWFGFTHIWVSLLLWFCGCACFFLLSSLPGSSFLGSGFFSAKC